MGVFVIAEAACTWRYGDELATAKRSIEAAKACGADAWKTQLCTIPHLLAERRKVTTNYDRLCWVTPGLREIGKLKDMCDSAGIEFMCTVFIPEDIPIIAPYVKRFKVSAFEADWMPFVQAHFYQSKETIVSSNDALNYQVSMKLPGTARAAHVLHCVSKYPTALKDLKLDTCHYEGVDGLSDHTANVLTGAVAVGCGAKIIEKHVSLWETPDSDPDFPHSLPCNMAYEDPPQRIPLCPFRDYVRNVREAERML